MKQLAGNESSFGVILYLSALIVLIFLVFSNSINVPFYWDDENLILNNYSLRNPFDFKAYFISNPIPQRPLVILSFAIDHILYGLKPAGYHINQVLLHFFNSVLVFLFAMKLTEERSASILAAFVFALHPIHTEAINLMLGRSDLLCCLFFLLSLLLYIKFSSSPDKGREEYFISLLAYIMALMSKEMAVGLPLAIILYELVLSKMDLKGLKKRAIYLIPYFLLTLVYVIFWFQVVGKNLKLGGSSEGVEVGLWSAELFQQMLMQVLVVKKYILLLVFPIGLSGWYEIGEVISFYDILSALAFFVALLALIAVVYKLNKRLFFSLCFILVATIPVSNILLIPGSMMAERWLYIPSIGFCIFVALSLIEFRQGKSWDQRGKWAFPAMIVTILLLCSVNSHMRNFDFKDEVIFFDKLSKRYPTSPFVRSNLGKALIEKGEIDRGIGILEMLLQGGGKGITEINMTNLGRAYEMKGRLDEAKRLYKEALKIKPDHLFARLNLGGVYYKEGKIEEAEEEFNRILELDPYNPHAKYNLGLLFDKRGQYEKAIYYYKDSIKYRSDFPDVHNSLGLDYYRIGLLNLAEKACKRALTIDPEYLQAYGNLGIINLARGDEKQALHNFKKVLELDPENQLAKVYIGDIEGGESSTSGE